MPAGDIYKHWLNAKPTNAFPFSFVDKTDGKMQMTWQDVRNGWQKDAQSASLPFCQAHMTPSVMQSQLIGDQIRREGRLLDKWSIATEESQRRAGSRMLLEAMRSTPDGASPPRCGSNLSLRASVMTAQERDLLTNTDGGRGRLAYLKHRRSMSPTERFGRPRTMQMMYGWNYDTPPTGQASTAPAPPSPA